MKNCDFDIETVICIIQLGRHNNLLFNVFLSILNLGYFFVFCQEEHGFTPMII